MDLGTGIAMGITLMLIFLIVGVPKRYLLALILAALGAVAGLIAMKPYRLQRLTSFLDPWADYYGKGYQVIQSLLAIGSGGLMGVGLGQGGAVQLFDCFCHGLCRFVVADAFAGQNQTGAEEDLL